MEIMEFVEETGRIEKFYEKELDKFQRDTWYQELKSISINRYRQIISQIFRECKFMPRLADVVSIQEQLPYRSKIEYRKTKCTLQ